jgi:hypothetical protein
MDTIACTCKQNMQRHKIMFYIEFDYSSAHSFLNVFGAPANIQPPRNVIASAAPARRPALLDETGPKLASLRAQRSNPGPRILPWIASAAGLAMTAVLSSRRAGRLAGAELAMTERAPNSFYPVPRRPRAHASLAP